MADVINFECSALPAGKRGVITKENGAYIQPVGAFNIVNSYGAYYPWRDAEALFHESAGLMRRIRNGDCKGEEGHPKPYGLTEAEYFQRISTIEEKSVCALHRRIWLDFNAKDDNGNNVILVMSEVVPSGYYGDALERSYETSKEGVNFSVRSFTNDQYSNGRVIKSMVELVTWDRVTEPGIDIARKFNSPALESYATHAFHRDDIIKANQTIEKVGMENSGVIVSPRSLFNAMGWEFKSTSAAKPSYLNWVQD